MVKIKDTKFCVKFWKLYEKGQKKFELHEHGFEPRFSVIFPPMIWIFMEGEGDEIKSRLGS